MKLKHIVKDKSKAKEEIKVLEWELHVDGNENLCLLCNGNCIIEVVPNGKFRRNFYVDTNTGLCLDDAGRIVEKIDED